MGPSTRKKKKQTQHNNHKEAWKTSVSKNDAKYLQLCYALGGGRWGNNFEYNLGDACLSLKIQKSPTTDPAMIHFLIMMFHNKRNSCIHNILVMKKKQRFMEKAESTVIQVTDCFGYIEKHATRELMLHLNAATSEDVPDVTWFELKGHPLWSVKKISAFRFYNHHHSFSMSLSGPKIHNKNKKKCIIKTNDNRILKFKHAYQFKYNNALEIVVAFGIIMPIHVSDRPHNWLDDKFQSMDYVDMKDRKCSWYFCTNFVEPVFLIHECVNLDIVRRKLPYHWRHQDSNAFYHDFAFNMYKMAMDKDEYHSSNVKKSIQLPCGPIFKCIQHHKTRCEDCPLEHYFFHQKQWKMHWVCNETQCSRYRILDAKNGLHKH